MLSAEESAELRILQVRAYGPNGGVSAAELERLRELEERLRVPSVAQPVSSRRLAALAQYTASDAPRPSLNDPQGSVSPHGAERVAPRAEGETKQGERAEPVEAATPARASGRLRWTLLIAASVALIVGLGVGWGIWGWNVDAYALASAHSEQRAQLEASDDFDRGTVAPLAEQYGVVVWQAERSDGEQVCVIVTGPDEAVQHGCTPSEQMKDSVWPNATMTVPEGQKKAGQQLVAGLIPTMTGELAPYIQVWDQNASDWESQYDDNELEQLREIAEAGYDGRMLSIIGYDGETAVWTNWTGNGYCIIAVVDDGPLEACAEDTESDITLIVSVGGVPTEYLVQQSEMRGPQLTIVRHPDATISEVSPSSGDPIEFTFDDPTFDDLVSDGETFVTDETPR